MKKEIIKARCTHMDEEGNGVINYKGTLIQVPHLIEGEEGVIQIHRHKEQVFGRLVEMTQKSPLRAEPPCPYYYTCGGCQLQHLKTDAQNAFKQQTVEKLLSPFGPVEALITMPDPLRYRNKSHTTYAVNRGAIVSGIYEARSHRLTSIDQCMIQNEQADAIGLTIRKMLPSFKLMPYDEDSGQGFLRHVLVRVGHYSKQVMVVLVVATPVFPSKNNFIQKLKTLHPEITTLLLNVNNRRTSMVLGHDEQVLFGKGYIEDTLCGLTFRLSPKSFYQVNPPQTQILYGKAVEFAGLTGKERIIDAYCGIGTISLIAAQKAKEVIGVELNEDAVRDAIANAKTNSIKNTRFVKGDAGEFMVQMAVQGEIFDVVLLDPPRSGSDERFLNSLINLMPSRIVYVSCNPVTLARDLKILTKRGYKVETIQPVDLFPMTYHVETVVKLVRQMGSVIRTEISPPIISSPKPAPLNHKDRGPKKPHKGRVKKMRG